MTLPKLNSAQPFMVTLFLTFDRNVSSVSRRTMTEDEAMQLDVLKLALRTSWAADTSIRDDWTSESPALGQCAVTALVVQDYLGGRLRRDVVEGKSHYWNELPGGELVDLTGEQFNDFNPLGGCRRERDYVLSFPDTAERYVRLAERVKKLMRS